MPQQLSTMATKFWAFWRAEMGRPGGAFFSRTRTNWQKLSVNSKRAAEPRAARVKLALCAQHRANVKSGRARAAKWRKMALWSGPRIAYLQKGDKSVSGV